MDQRFGARARPATHGNDITRANLINTLNNRVHGWNTEFGPVESYWPQNHSGQLDSALMAVQGAGTPTGGW